METPERILMVVVAVASTAMLRIKLGKTNKVVLWVICVEQTQNFFSNFYKRKWRIWSIIRDSRAFEFCFFSIMFTWIKEYLFFLARWYNANIFWLFEPCSYFVWSKIFLSYYSISSCTCFLFSCRIENWRGSIREWVSIGLGLRIPFILLQNIGPPKFCEVHPKDMVLLSTVMML